MKFKIILIIAFFFSLTNVRAQFKRNFLLEEEVPEIILGKFYLLYPNQNRGLVKWKYERNGYEGYIISKHGVSKGLCFFDQAGSMSFRVYVNKEGIRLGREVEVKLQSLPQKIIEHSEEKDLFFAIKQLDSKENVTGYVLLTKKNKRLIYNRKGKFISSIK